MIALDTNVVVRFLIEDDATQSERAASVVRHAPPRGLYLSDVVLCETVWVLTSAYKVPRADVGSTLRRMLEARQFSFDETEGLRRALAAFAAGQGDFADYLIRERARSAGCEKVLTFDRALLKEEGFSAP